MGAMQVIPVGLEAFSAVNEVAGAMITTVGSADAAAMMGSAAAGVGPIGVGYLAAYGPAQGSNLASTLLVGLVHGATGIATTVSKIGYVAVDSAIEAVTSLTKAVGSIDL